MRSLAAVVIDLGDVVGGLGVVVPIKALAEAKQRLAPVLSPAERAGLVLAMARDVLDAAIAAVGRANVWVCCGDDAGVEIARSMGVRVLRDDAPDCGLNRTIAGAMTELESAGYHRILVIHADLPWLSAEDVAVACNFAVDQVMLVSDHSGEGSNLLGWGLRTGFVAGYGEGSCARHRARAASAGLPVCAPPLPWAGLDVDCPEDLALLFGATESGRAMATRRWLAEANLSERLSGLVAARDAAIL